VTHRHGFELAADVRDIHDASPSERVELSGDERDVMEHATGWASKSRLYRNHFCASEGHADWHTLGGLCARGLMRRHEASALTGGDAVFVVTPSGIAALEHADARGARA
jgi:hypothetical protein